MGVRIRVGGVAYEAISYMTTEESTPTSSDDSSGSVGTIEFELVNVETPFLLDGQEVSLIDTRRGSTLGFVTQVSESDIGSVSISCQTRLGRLNSYDIQAQPFIGTLRDAFLYYASLGEQETDVLVDDQIGNRPVVFQGWSGELWFHLKQMAAAEGCEIALVSGVILLRPLRVREAIDHRDITRERTYGGTSLARAVEVYSYSNTPITDELVYPPGGWTPETEVITVGAGEVVERIIELSASVTSIQQPVMQTFVDMSYDASSVYTVVGDDGLPIMPQQWLDYGGRLNININSDTTSLTVTLQGATGIFSAKGEAISTFSLALGASSTGNRYSTLRITGTGVAFDRKSILVRTCLPDRVTGTDIGITIDNPFLSTINQAWSAGVRAARWYAGERMELNGTVTSINQLGESGIATYPKYSFDQAQHEGQTYAQVQAENSGLTYYDIQESYYDLVRNDFANQVFGNVNGARVWDRKSAHWYRIRTASPGPGEISFQAEDDLVHNDYQGRYEGLTYDEEQLMFVGRTYSQRDRLGLIGGITAEPSYIPPYPSNELFPAPSLYPMDL